MHYFCNGVQGKRLNQGGKRSKLVFLKMQNHLESNVLFMRNSRGSLKSGMVRRPLHPGVNEYQLLFLHTCQNKCAYWYLIFTNGTDCLLEVNAYQRPWKVPWVKVANSKLLIFWGDAEWDSSWCFLPPPAKIISLWRNLLRTNKANGSTWYIPVEKPT